MQDGKLTDACNYQPICTYAIKEDGFSKKVRGDMGVLNAQYIYNQNSMELNAGFSLD